MGVPSIGISGGVPGRGVGWNPAVPRLACYCSPVPPQGPQVSTWFGKYGEGRTTPDPPQVVHVARIGASYRQPVQVWVMVCHLPVAVL